jgi:hypothetical protein
MCYGKRYVVVGINSGRVYSRLLKKLNKDKLYGKEKTTQGSDCGNSQEIPYPEDGGPN